MRPTRAASSDCSTMTKSFPLRPVRHDRALVAARPKSRLAIFSQELVALLDAGLSLVESHRSARPRRNRTPRVRVTLEQFLSRLYEGQTLGRGARRSIHRIFPYAVRRHCARQRTHRRPARGADAATSPTSSRSTPAQDLDERLASIRPCCLGAGVLVTLFLMGYVVPRFSAIYADLGRTCRSRRACC